MTTDKNHLAAVVGSGSVLLGLSRGGAGDPATDWAAREATARGVALTVIRAYSDGLGALAWHAPDVGDVTRARTTAESLVARTVDHLQLRWPELPVTAWVEPGPATALLVDASTHAAITVLGVQHAPPIEAALLGSIATTVAATAFSPVVVVAGPAEFLGEQGSIVVGVSPRGVEPSVLEFAFARADAQGCPLRAVLCLPHGDFADDGSSAAPPTPAGALTWLDKVLDGWTTKYPGVIVERDVAGEHPVAGLVERAYGQRLLVVGSHSLRPHVDAWLGSISQGVLRHARCPVAVIPARGS